MGIELHLRITFHSQIDGKLERTIQTLEDMLKPCALDYVGRWDCNLPIVEFVCNNRYPASIRMAQFEAFMTAL